jgi:tetratricopeptide (TPR) repeat protein
MMINNTRGPQEETMMKTFEQMLVLPLVLCVAAPAYSDTDFSSPAAKALPTGIATLVQDEQYDQAITELEKFVKKEKRNADAWNLLGYSQRKTSMLEVSLKSYKKALKLDRKHLGAHEYIGELYLTMADPDKAIYRLKKLKKYCKDCVEYQELAEAIEKFEQGS